MTFEGALEQLKSTSISSLKLTSKFISSGKSGTASSSVVSDSLSFTSAYIDPNSLFDLTLIFPIIGAFSSSNSPKNMEASKSKSFGSSSILSNILLFEKLSTSINKLCIASLLNSSKLTSIWAPSPSGSQSFTPIVGEIPLRYAFMLMSPSSDISKVMPSTHSVSRAEASPNSISTATYSMLLSAEMLSSKRSP